MKGLHALAACLSLFQRSTETPFEGPRTPEASGGTLFSRTPCLMAFFDDVIALAAAVASAAANASALSSTTPVIDPSTAFNSLSSLAATTQSHTPGPTASPVGLAPFLPPHPPPCPIAAPGGASNLPLGVEDLQQRLGASPGVDASGRGLAAPGQLMPSSCGVPPLGQGGNPAGLLKQDPFLLQHMPMQTTDHPHSPLPPFPSLGSLPRFQESLSLPDLNGGVIASIETRDRRAPPHRENETDTQLSTECSEEKSSGGKGETGDAVALRERGRADPAGSSRSTPPGQDPLQFQQDLRQESEGPAVGRAACHSSSLTVTEEEEERGDPGANCLGQLSLPDAPRESSIPSDEIKGPLRLGQRKLCTADNTGEQLPHVGSQRHGSTSAAWNGGGDVRPAGGAFAADPVPATESRSSFSKVGTPVPFDTGPSVCCPQTERENKPRQGERPEFEGGCAHELAEQKRSGSLCSPTRGTGTRARTEMRRREYDQRPSWEFSAENHPTAEHIAASAADRAVKADSPEGKRDREKDRAYCGCFDGSRSHADRGSRSFRMKVEDRTGGVSSHQEGRTQSEEEEMTALATERESFERKRGTSSEVQAEKKRLDEKREEMRKRRRESGTHSDEDPSEGRRAPRTSSREGSYHLNAAHDEKSEAPCGPQASLSARQGSDAFLYPPSRHHAPSRRSECGKVLTATTFVEPFEGGTSPSHSSPTMRDSIQKQRGTLPEEEAHGFLSVVRTRRSKPDSCANKDGEEHGNEESEEPMPRAGEPEKEDRGDTAMRETEEVTRFSSRTKIPQSRRSLPGLRHENGGDKVRSRLRGNGGARPGCSFMPGTRDSVNPHSDYPQYCLKLQLGDDREEIRELLARKSRIRLPHLYGLACVTRGVHGHS